MSTYDPVRLLDGLLRHFQVNNDAQLCKVIGISHPVISRIRSQADRVVTSAILLRIHEASGLSIRELRQMMGDTSPGYWMGPPVERKRSLGANMKKKNKGAV